MPIWNGQKKFRFDQPQAHLGFIVGEYFHQDLGNFGGYGITVKNFADHYNHADHHAAISAIIPCGFPIVEKPEVRSIHGTRTLLCPLRNDHYVLNFIKYQRLLNQLKNSLFITLDYSFIYEMPLLASAGTHCLVWIRDPRGEIEWDKIATVAWEMKILPQEGRQGFLKLSDEAAQSLARVLRLSKILKRKIIFATNSPFLTQRAQRAYKLPQLTAHWLPNPIPMPAFKEMTFSPKPSLCFLGRLEPQKRFWIVGELAKRFKNVDFHFAGVTGFPEHMNSIIERYASLSNVKFLGLLDGHPKERLLRETWGLINTSIHEGLPVSFLEAMSYGKCVISCLNPENLVDRFGYFTGEFLGDGLDESALNLFAEKIEELLQDKQQRIEKGHLGQQYVRQHHSFENFERRLHEILVKEGI